VKVTEQPSGSGDITSARNKSAAGNAGQFQNKRYIDPVLKDEREEEMNENLGFVVRRQHARPADPDSAR
jgi:hypothetical protein